MNLEAAAPVAPSQLDVKRISAISLDLDDTLWPVWPAIERAERVLHAWLVKEAPGILGTTSIKWNFTKFLIGKKGQVLGRYAPTDTPKGLKADIDKALAA